MDREFCASFASTANSPVIPACRVQGERYFECRQGYGLFVRPGKVETGDFPVEEINFDEEM